MALTDLFVGGFFTKKLKNDTFEWYLWISSWISSFHALSMLCQCDKRILPLQWQGVAICAGRNHRYSSHGYNQWVYNPVNDYSQLSMLPLLCIPQLATEWFINCFAVLFPLENWWQCEVKCGWLLPLSSKNTPVCILNSCNYL